jgi:hypothetical protein
MHRNSTESEYYCLYTIGLLSYLYYYYHICTETPPVGQNQNTAIIISLVIAYILSSVLIFIIGCACGWLGHKHRAKGSDKNTRFQAASCPVYEDLQPPASMPRDQTTFELKENVAYGPVPVRST